MFWKNWSWPVRIWVGLSVLFLVSAGFGLRALNNLIEFNIVQGHCPSNLKQIGLGFMQYTQDYDGKLPTATVSDGWGNALQPYLRTTEIFKCPWAPDFRNHQPNPKLPGYTDYFFNSQLQSLRPEKLHAPEQLVVVADGNGGKEKTDASYAMPGIPTFWRTDPTSPVFRHEGEGYYLFADGHVKRLKAQDVSNHWDAKKFRFQPRK